MLMKVYASEEQQGDDELKYAQNQASSGRYSSSLRETSTEPEPVSFSGWDHYGDNDLHSQGKSSVSLAQSLPIPYPELKAFTMSKRFSGSTDPSSLKYVTLLYHKISNHIGCKSIDQEEDKMSAHLTRMHTQQRLTSSCGCGTNLFQ